MDLNDILPVPPTVDQVSISSAWSVIHQPSLFSQLASDTSTEVCVAGIPGVGIYPAPVINLRYLALLQYC